MTNLVKKPCTRCAGRTASGRRCQNRAACRVGKRTRCSLHTKSPRYDVPLPVHNEDDLSDEDKVSSDDEEVSSDDEHHTTSRKYPPRSLARLDPQYFDYYPENGQYEDVAGFPREKGWDDLTGRIYAPVNCDEITRKYGVPSARHFYKCGSNGQTREGYDTAEWLEKYKKFQDDPMGIEYLKKNGKETDTVRSKSGRRYFRYE